jgi:alpha-ketoglutarate-dependent taurine dioxygenase
MRRYKENIGSLTCFPMTTHIGAVIEGIDLTTKIHPNQFEDISRALVEYQVIDEPEVFIPI